MASAIKVQFKKFKWNKDGYRQLKNSSMVQMQLASKAAGVLNRANAQVNRGFECKHVVLPRAKDEGYVIRTATAKAREKQAENNILLKSLEA